MMFQGTGLRGLFSTIFLTACTKSEEMGNRALTLLFMRVSNYRVRKMNKKPFNI